MSAAPHDHDNPYPGPIDPARVEALERRMDSAETRVQQGELTLARLDERSATITRDIGQMRADVASGMDRIEKAIDRRVSGVTRWAVVLGTLFITGLIGLAFDLLGRL